VTDDLPSLRSHAGLTEAIVPGPRSAQTAGGSWRDRDDDPEPGVARRSQSEAYRDRLSWRSFDCRDPLVSQSEGAMTWEHAEKTAKPVLKCPLCGGTEFDQQQGRMDSRWGLTSHKLVMKICRTCGLVLQFSAGRGIFDFD